MKTTKWVASGEMQTYTESTAWLKSVEMKTHIVLFVLSLIGSGTLQPDSGQASNGSLGNVAELHDALKKIERFIEAEEIADALKAGMECDTSTEIPYEWASPTLLDCSNW